MSEQYDIYFAGKIVEGFDVSAVRENIARLFKADEKTLEKLFSGKPQAIKRGVDKQTAIKYKAALEKAGAVPLIRPVARAQPAPSTGSESDELPSSSAIGTAAATKTTPASAGEGSTLADRVAALAAEEPPAPASSRDEVDEETGLSLLPLGSEVLRQDERETVEEIEVDISAIELSDPQDDSPLEAAAPPPPPAPDISHLSMGEVGEDIPHLENVVQLINPDTSHLSMAAVGEEIPHLESNVQPLNPDTSGIELAPEGSAVLEEQYRKRETAVAPNTDHLALEA